jgi:UDP-glucose 6-dehydrogenase
VQDTLRPDRLVAGSRSAAADATLRSVYVLPLGQWRAAGWTVRSLAGVR